MDRPDLDEFLTALDGFLDRPAAPEDAGTLKFLDIFCRSVGASEGHLLKANPDGRLTSLASLGVSPKFNREFNEARPSSGGPSPLDLAFQEQKVVPVINLKEEKSVPAWFKDFMATHGFKSLVAVPLLNHNNSVGVLCAYYNDVCLFDQGTVERLQMIGRMVGTSMEKSKEDGLDDLLRKLGESRFSRFQLFGAITEAMARSLESDGVFWGPARKAGEDWQVTVASGAGLPESAITQRYVMPRALADQMDRAPGSQISLSLPEKEWGDLKSLPIGRSRHAMCVPMRWAGEIKAGVVVWRNERPFSSGDVAILTRMAGLVSIILHSSNAE